MMTFSDSWTFWVIAIPGWVAFWGIWAIAVIALWIWCSKTK